MDDYVRRLQELTGEDDVWEETTTTPPRSPVASSSQDHDTIVDDPWAGKEVVELTLSSDGDDSDASTTMVLSKRHLKLDQERKHRSSTKSTTTRVSIDEKTGLKQATWPEYELNIGDVSSEDTVFCPWKLVREYPSMFVGKRNSERSSPFFESTAIHKNQVWDFFYLYNPQETSRKSVLFVPTYQFERLLDFVNAELSDTNLTIPTGVNTEKFCMRFGLGQTPRPRFLGRSTDVQSFEDLNKMIPSMDKADKLDGVSSAALDDFLERLNMIHRASGKSKNKSARNQVKRVQDRKAWGKSLKRAQRYLGLRQRVTSPLNKSANMDLDSVLQNQPEGRVRFISIDIEAYEFNQDIITEVGLAVFDTLDIQTIPPGKDGQNWMSLIRGHHIRIRENTWAQNKRHVTGCADKFNFG
jgi:hypothetical protein